MERQSLPETRTAETPPSWMGAIAGMGAAAVALAFGQFIEGATDVPGLVLGVGEWIIDITPGWVAERSIEDLGTAGKGNLLPGITIVSFLLAAGLGSFALRRGTRYGVAGFAAFGLLGGFATARNPQSPALASWFWSLVAAGLGVATLIFLLNRAHASVTTPDVDDLPSPLNPPHSRRAFIGWGAGAGAVALTGIAAGRATMGKSAAEIARDSTVLPAASSTSPSSTTSTTTTTEPAAGALTDRVASVTGDTFDEISGISPWVSPSTDGQFYLIDTALSKPQVDPAKWRLSFTGMVDNPYELSYDEILGMDLVEQTITMSCVSNEVGGSLVGNAVWTGVPLVDLLDRAGVQEGATQVVARSVDDWTAGFPTEVLFDGRNSLLVVGMNGEPLPIRHGFPARLVVAGLYGYVSATKWIEEINLTRWDDFNGYWVNLGWAKEGPMKTMSRIDVPRNRTRIEQGLTPVAGVAWAPTSGIESVELSIDEGPWIPCDLAIPGSDEAWVQWKLEWDATPGIHSLQVRAHDGNGDLQPIGPKAVAPDGAEGWHQALVEVV